MKTELVAIRIDENTSALVKGLMKYGFARTKADAVRMIMESGIGKATEVVELRERAEHTLSKWKKQGMPKLPSNLSEKSIQDRD